MHEYSITEALVHAVEEEVRALAVPAPVREVRLSLGLFSGAVRGPVEFYYDLLTSEGPLAGSRLVVEEVPLTLHCKDCGHDWIGESACFVCTKCGSFAVEITGGKEMLVESILFADEEER
ncbi:MAG: hydrogenase maturation nickel metallochaperone HypA [Gemmatimonadota bacterium]|jgi:hydrogenase nickel incorporation protein HypA/HybF|nr:hypothetical protein [Gemmatimonadota bacterium]MDP6461965.1 hydrogenase maturation nickel metallochaperone HypA [Gemmatimonadota bacterium]MDP6528959.1 hydrogenase maturation nickel metallochaperone HypA [Gemmatimonadota bacterium]MDP6802043.1 hydrogenase maturation nickel metallochaperone HypA [Gemmatimonadota bacterium]MDP7031391.1 hydrogenase maturation nickel metallochaperone HypA [Gemmatimonadota bacterium]